MRLRKNVVTSIVHKEVLCFLYSPSAFVIAILFAMVSGWFFFNTLLVRKVSDMRDFFNMLPIFLSILIPAITMKQFSEEFSSGSFEMLVTLPISLWEIVVAKFCSSFLMCLFVLLPTIFYAFTVEMVGDLQWGVVVCSYVGAIFLSAAFVAIGIFSSSLTKNQVIAWMLGCGMCVFLVVIEYFLALFPVSIGRFFRYLSIVYHFDSAAKGVLDFRDILYFLSICFLSIWFSVVSLRNRLGG